VNLLADERRKGMMTVEEAGRMGGQKVKKNLLKGKRTRGRMRLLMVASSFRFSFEPVFWRWNLRVKQLQHVEEVSVKAEAKEDNTPTEAAELDASALL
jgi:hypothetical protein